MPRLLPVTSFVLAALLALKSVDLVRAAVPASNSDKAAQSQSANDEKADAKIQKPFSEAQPPAVPSGTMMPPISPGERSILTDLRRRRQELDARAKALDARSVLLGAEERQINQRIAELQDLQKKLEAMNARRKQREDASWQGLVKLYQAMDPRDAAKIFDDLDMNVLLQVVDRMKEAKAAAILATMQPDKARSLTDALAHMRMQREQPAASAGG